jgi:cytidylate kinase
MKSMHKRIEEQVQRWQIQQREQPQEKESIPIVTISREPGSGGVIVAQQLAEKLGFEVFHQEVLHEMAKRTEISKQFLATLDERGLTVLEDWLTSLVHERHLWPDQYLRHLMNVIGTIGKHGRAIVIGRGANFILPPEQRFRVRITASRRVRIEYVAREHNLTLAEAKRRVINTESNRRAFIRKYFNADIADPTNYDLVINTETLKVDHAVNIIGAALGCLVECAL